MTGEHIETALGEQLATRYHQLADQLEMYVGDDYGKAFARSPAKASRYMEYWQKNAAYIKNNIDKAFKEAVEIK